MSSNRLFETNDYSIQSKYSTVKQGYVEDPKLIDLIEYKNTNKQPTRTSLVHRGYAARMLAMQWVINRAIKSENIDTFIVLGGGYDMLPFKREYSFCTWIDIDLSPVIKYKCEAINGLDLVDDFKVDDERIYTSSKNYHMIDCDMLASEKLEKSLNKLFHITGSPRRVAIVNEVCLCYSEPKDVQLILTTVIRCVQDTSFKIQYIGLEQVQPTNLSEFSKVMTNHFHDIGHSLKYFPSPNHIRELFLEKLAFHSVTVLSMYQVYHNILLETRLETPAFKKELFDEYEELDLYLGHYALVTATKVLKDPFLSVYEEKVKFYSDVKSEDGLDFSDKFQMSFLPSHFERYAHSSCIISETCPSKTTILVSGGFGETCSSSETISKPGIHKRLDDSFLLTIDNDNQIVDDMKLDAGNMKSHLSKMHARVVSLNNSRVFFNGGRYSPNKMGLPTFVSRIDLENHTITLEEDFNLENDATIGRFRHRILQINEDEVVQVGGLSFGSDTLQCPIIWNLSSSKMGFNEIDRLRSSIFSRHSFGMDKKNHNTILLFGGLRTGDGLNDQSITPEESSVMWDVRIDKYSTLPLKSKRCYDCHIHFISDYEFIRIGGICSLTGLSLEEPEVTDLRNYSSFILKCKPFNFTRPLMFTNATTCNIVANNSIMTLGGGGNYFTFGTKFNKDHVFLKYL